MNAAISQPRWLSLSPRGPLSSAEAVAKPTRWIYVITASRHAAASTLKRTRVGRPGRYAVSSTGRRGLKVLELVQLDRPGGARRLKSDDLDRGKICT